MMKTITQLLFFTMLMMLGSTVQAQYCMLQGRTIYSANQPGITNFKLNTIDRTSGNVEKPLTQPSLVITGESTTLERGQTYTVSITHSKDNVFFPTARNNIRMWIDFDGNKDFSDAGETVLTTDFEAAGTYTGSITIPANAPLGTTKLRVTAKMSSDAGHTVPTPCDMPKDPLDYHGEMEDYDVTITDGGTTSITQVTNTKLVAAVYPNPTSNDVTVVLNEINKAVTIDLYDVTGRLISNMINDNSGATTYNIQLNDHVATTGVFFIKVSSGSNSAYQRVVKVN